MDLGEDELGSVETMDGIVILAAVEGEDESAFSHC